MARKPAIWRYDPVQRAALLREGEQYPSVHDVAQRPTSHVGTDARGPAFTRSANGGVDIGAFELQTIRPPRVTSTIFNDGSAQRSMVTSLTVTFNTNVVFAGNPATAFSLSRNGGGAVNIRDSKFSERNFKIGRVLHF